MSDTPKLADLNLDDDDADRIDPDTCTHAGDVSRKFGGSIVCDDCNLVIGNWRTSDRVTITATKSADGTFHPTDGSAP